MTDGSSHSSTVIRRMEKSMRTQHEANSYRADKENRVRKESDSSSGVVKRMKMRFEEISKSQKYIPICSTTNVPAAGAIKKKIIVDRPIENREEKIVTSKKRVNICEDDVFAKSRFKVYEDEKPKIITESVHNNIAKGADGHFQQQAQHRNLFKLQLTSSESRGSTVQPRFTPIDAPLVPLVPKKVKVLHRQSLMNANQKPNGQIISTSQQSLTYKLPYDDEFIKLEMSKDKSMLRGSRGFRRQNITITQRNIIVKFLTRLNAHSFYPSAFLYQTVRIFDAALDAKRIGVEELQLTALAAMWIALKRDHTVHSVPSATNMLAYSNDLYEGKPELLLKCEREILQSLNYEISFPDPFSILCYDITKCDHSIFMNENQTELAYYCGGYMIDLSLFDENLMHTPVALLVAAAAETALYFVLEDVNSGLEPVWSKWRAPHTAKCYSEDEISRVRSRLIEKIAESNRRHTDGEVVFKKYSRSRYGKISRFLGKKVRLFLAPECPINLN